MWSPSEKETDREGRDLQSRRRDALYDCGFQPLGLRIKSESRKCGRVPNSAGAAANFPVTG